MKTEQKKAMSKELKRDRQKRSGNTAGLTLQASQLHGQSAELRQLAADRLNHFRIYR